MDKKDLKFYEAPTSEAVELKLEGILCASKIEVEGVDDDDLGGGNNDLFG
jgi:hypothetical protein